MIQTRGEVRALAAVVSELAATVHVLSDPSAFGRERVAAVFARVGDLVQSAQQIAGGVHGRSTERDGDEPGEAGDEHEQRESGGDVGEEESDPAEHAAAVPDRTGAVARVVVAGSWVDDEGDLRLRRPWVAVALAVGEVETLRQLFIDAGNAGPGMVEADDLFDRLEPLWAVIDDG